MASQFRLANCDACSSRSSIIILPLLAFSCSFLIGFRPELLVRLRLFDHFSPEHAAFYLPSIVFLFQYTTAFHTPFLQVQNVIVPHTDPRCSVPAFDGTGLE